MSAQTFWELRLSAVSTMEDDDPFAASMMKLNLILKKQLLPETDTCPEDSRIKLIEENVRSSEISRVRQKADERIKWLEASFNHIINVRKVKISNFQSRIRKFHINADSEAAKQKLVHFAFERKLDKQFINTTRRLQDLVFECVGESEKTIGRFVELAKHQRISIEAAKLRENDNHAWKMFLLRLNEDSVGAITAEYVSPTEHKDTFKAAESLFTKHPSSSTLTVGQCALVSYRNSGRNANQKGVFRKSTGVENLNELLSSLYSDAGIRSLTVIDTSHPRLTKSTSTPAIPSEVDAKRKFERKIPKNISRHPLFESNKFLHAGVINWLLWPQFSTCASDSRLYYCVEERFNGLQKEATVDPLGDIYVGTSTRHANSAQRLETVVLRCTDQGSWPSGMMVNRLDGRHRRHYRNTNVESYPDMVVVNAPKLKGVDTNDEDAGELHFAPAKVQNLLEVRRFLEQNTTGMSAVDRTALRTKYGPAHHNVLQHLYVLLPVDPKRHDPMQLVPISQEAMDELLGCYLVRSLQLENHCLRLLSDRRACAMFPASFSPTVEKVVTTKLFNRKPKELQTVAPPIDYKAVLVCEGPVEPSKIRATLSHSCMWRACTAVLPNGDNTDDGLCKYHFNVAEQILKQKDGMTEIKKFMPKISAETLNRKCDEETIMKASALVGELLSGKLSSTVKVFCTKAAETAKPNVKTVCAKDRIENFAEFQRSIHEDLELARMVLTVESMVVDELRKLMALGVFPSEELVAIRHEYRILDEERQRVFKAVDSVLFKSRTEYLDKEYRRLVDEKHNSSNNIEQVIMRPRRLIETELELEFCLRKVSILKSKREQVQDGSQPQQDPSIRAFVPEYRSKKPSNNIKQKKVQTNKRR